MSRFLMGDSTYPDSGKIISRKVLLSLFKPISEHGRENISSKFSIESEVDGFFVFFCPFSIMIFSICLQ